MVRNILKKQGGGKSAKKNSKKLNHIQNLNRIFTSKKGVMIIGFVSLIIISATGWMWWSKTFMNPDRVFHDMLANNLRTTSFTRHIVQENGNEGVNQTSHVSFQAPFDYSKSSTALTQRISGNKKSTIVTETIGTNSADYVRYTGVNGVEGLAGADNVKKLIGTWAKRETSSQTGQQVTFFSESLFGFLPTGDLNPAQRAKLLNSIDQKDVYKIVSSEKKTKKARPVFIYTVNVNAKSLVSVLQEYATMINSSSASQFDPEQYAQTPDLMIKVTVDIVSRQLSVIENPASSRVETFSGHNLIKAPGIPPNTIPVEELQKRLNS